MTSQQDQRLEIAMGNMLRIGVTVAAIVVIFGSVLYLIQLHGSTPDYHTFHGAPPDTSSLHAIIAGLSHFDGRSVIAFGLLLLIATPTCRVLFGLVGFSIERDGLYVAVSATVLVILLASLFMGK